VQPFEDLARTASSPGEGVTLLEKKLRETRPAYRGYAEETSAFFSWLPRRRGGGRHG
jgi:hypothetical protein